MNRLFKILAVVTVLLTASHAVAQDEKSFETITFPSADGLEITADVYAPHEDKSTPFIVLCHQAGWSRGEYREIAPKLNELGFNCMAIDQRSGGGVNDVENLTVAKAKEADLETTFLDAQQDIVAALEYAHRELAEDKVILWGSSYSAALALVVAGEHNDLVDGVLSFAPGEYFARFGKSGDWVKTHAAQIADPAFITSARNEFQGWESIFEAIEGDAKQKFVPETKGNHGSRALWEKFDDHEAYWESVTAFLAQFTADEASENAPSVVHEDFQAAVEQANKTGKPIFVYAFDSV